MHVMYVCVRIDRLQAFENKPVKPLKLFEEDNTNLLTHL